MVLPNQLTTLRILLTPVFFFLFLSGDPTYIQISVVVYLIAAITDWYDGWLARKFNYITDWGKFMDPLADKILTTAAFFAFASIGIIEYWMVWVVVLRDIFVTSFRIYAEYKKNTIRRSNSAKIKTFLQMIFIYYLLLISVVKTFPSFYEKNLSLFNTLSNQGFIYYSMLFITVFTAYTAIRYIIQNRAIIKRLISK